MKGNLDFSDVFCLSVVVISLKKLFFVMLYLNKMFQISLLAPNPHTEECPGLLSSLGEMLPGFCCPTGT
jgi:hypothetical protein